MQVTNINRDMIYKFMEYTCTVNCKFMEYACAINCKFMEYTCTMNGKFMEYTCTMNCVLYPCRVAKTRRMPCFSQKNH